MKYSETFRRLGRLDKTVDDEEVVTCFQGIILSLQTKFTPSWEEELACNRNSFPTSDGSDFSKTYLPMTLHMRRIQDLRTRRRKNQGVSFEKES